jgi:hypothetical protein
MKYFPYGWEKGWSNWEATSFAVWSANGKVIFHEFNKNTKDFIKVSIELLELKNAFDRFSWKLMSFYVVREKK